MYKTCMNPDACLWRRRWSGRGSTPLGAGTPAWYGPPPPLLRRADGTAYLGEGQMTPHVGSRVHSRRGARLMARHF